MIYLDHAATTKPFEEVLQAMQEVSLSHFGNPSSLHDEGIKARKKMNQTRKQLASHFNVNYKQLIATSSGTEAINFILRGVAKKHPQKAILSTTSEHHAVKHCLEQLAHEGHQVVFLPVNEQGLLAFDTYQEALQTYDVALVSILYANNETGVIQPMNPLIHAAHQAGAFMHVDMVQVPLHQSVDLTDLNVDFASFSAHKFHGPRGVGLAYVKDLSTLEKLIHGGKQEFELRAGTENLAGLVGTLRALDLVSQHRETWEATIEARVAFFLQCLHARPIDYRVNGTPLDGPRIKGTLNLGFKDVDAQQLSFYLNQRSIYLSLGSACSSSNIEPSHVLKAMHVPQAYLHGSLRFSFGPDISERDILYVVDSIEHYITEATQV